MKKMMILVAALGGALLVQSCGRETGALDVGEADLNKAYTITVENKDEHGSIVVTRKKADYMEEITISAYPAQASAIDDGGEDEGEPVEMLMDEGGGGGTDKRWYPAPVIVTEGGKESRPVFNTFNIANNEYIFKFKMPYSNITVKSVFTDQADETTPLLAWIGLSAGNISPDFSSIITDYTIEVPHDTTNFEVTAGGVNPIAKVAMQLSSDTAEIADNGLLGQNLISSAISNENDPMLIKESTKTYKIKVRSQNGSNNKTYNLAVTWLPDLTLENLYLIKATVKEKLDHQGAATPEGIRLVVNGKSTIIGIAPNNSYVNVNVSFDGNNITTINNGTSGEQILTQATISSIAENTYKPVKIVVSKLVGAKTYAKTYTIYLTYSSSATFPKSQLASGGYVSFIEGEKDEWFELHTFSEAGTESNLIFSNISSLAGGTVTADVLIVAGGGGAGVNGNVDDGSGGGGAGGLLYFTNRADELTSRSGSAIQIAEGTISVFVGTGGAGGAFSNFGSDGKQNGLEGQNGGDSAFGLYTAIGGGASRGLYPGNSAPGKNGNDGGSGGGGDGSRVEQGGLGGLAIRATSGSASGILQGYDGGKSAFNDGGGGGGGAGGAGGDGNDSDLIKTNAKIVTGGAGGQGKTISITGETKTYSRGGNGGGNNTPLVEASYYGDGAPGTNNSQKTTGYSGYQGIVIVLFPNDTGVTP